MHFKLSFPLQNPKAKKRKHDEIDVLDEMPENVGFHIKNGSTSSSHIFGFIFKEFASFSQKLLPKACLYV